MNIAARGGEAVFVNQGDATISGATSGADSIIGGAQGSVTYTGHGANLLVSNNYGAADVTTGNGASLIFAGHGNLSLTGGAGSMTALIGEGQEVITEGSGAATYDLLAQSGAGEGSVTIFNFDPAKDALHSFGYLTGPAVTHVGGSTQLHYSDGTSINLVGVANYTPALGASG